MIYTVRHTPIKLQGGDYKWGDKITSEDIGSDRTEASMRRLNWIAEIVDGEAVDTPPPKTGLAEPKETALGAPKPRGKPRRS